LQDTRAGAVAFHWERRERVLLRDIRRFGTATGQLSVVVGSVRSIAATSESADDRGSRI
jgi:hypothetical protein